MKKFSNYFLMLFAVASMAVLSSCGGEDDPVTPGTTDPCGTVNNYPVSTGTSTLTFIAPQGTTSNGMYVVSAAAGDALSIAVLIAKGTGNRPQKLDVFVSGCTNELGTQVTDLGRDANNKGTIDLRNTDSQTRQVLYTVPSGLNPIYLTFRVNESGSDFTYTRMKINVAGSGIIDFYSNVILGANTNALASRMSSATGNVFLSCETQANIEFIDLTYAVSTASPFNPYLASNPARYQSPINLTQTVNNSCPDDPGGVMVNGGRPTYFAPVPTVDFDGATNATLDGLNVSVTDDQYVQISQGGTYAFYRERNSGNFVKGLIRVDAITNGTSGGKGDGTLQIDIKVQR